MTRPGIIGDWWVIGSLCVVAFCAGWWSWRRIRARIVRKFRREKTR